MLILGFLEQEGEGVLVRVEKTTSHCGVERKRERVKSWLWRDSR